MNGALIKFRNSAVHFLKKRRNQKVINYYDGIKREESFSLGASLKNLGHLTVPCCQLFGKSIDKKIVDQVKLGVFHNEFGNYINHDIPLDFLKLILVSNPLLKLAKEYIGEDCRLDDIYLWSKSLKFQNSFDISEGWHSDEVGRRLKCFISLDCELNSPTTLYIEGSNLRSYKAKFLPNFFRYFGYISKKKDLVVEHIYKNDEVFIFDTNGEHRGNYFSKTGQRFFLVIELINRHKSNIIFKDCPCGPGQANGGIIFFPKEIKQELINCPLIDKSILRYDDKKSCYSYSILNLL